MIEFEQVVSHEVSETRVAIRDWMFQLARVTVAIVIAKKYLLAMELVDRKQIETPLDDLTVDDLWIWDPWTVT